MASLISVKYSKPYKCEGHSCQWDWCFEILFRWLLQRDRKWKVSKSFLLVCPDKQNFVMKVMFTSSKHFSFFHGHQIIWLQLSDLLAMLVRLRGSTNFATEQDCTPLMEACAAGNVRSVKCLLDLGADVNAYSITQNTPLIYAAAAGQEKACLDFCCTHSLCEIQTLLSNFLLIVGVSLISSHIL